MRLRGAMVAALALAVLSGSPSSAGADGSRYLLRAGERTRIDLAGTNGYRIHIYANDRRKVTLVARKEGFTTSFTVKGVQVGADRVQARLAGLGSISVRFLQRGPTHRPPAYSNCDGPRPNLRQGVVRGMIKFTGEREYTQVKAHQAHAEIEEWSQQHCRYGTAGRRRRRRRPTNELEAFGPEAYFFATKYPPGVLKGGQVEFFAAISSPRGPVEIARRVTVVAPASTFRVPEPSTYPEHAILTPPAPFTGSGTFSRTSESVFSWEGDLAIQFPGIDSLSLTGANFETSYCARRSCVHQDAEPEPGTS